MAITEPFPWELVSHAARISLIQAIGSVFFSAGVGIFFAYLELSLPRFPSRAARTLSLLCFSMPTLLVVLCMTAFWGRNGLLGHFLNEHTGFNFYGYFGVLIAHTFLNFAVFFRPLQLALNENGMQEEAEALSLGATRFQVFRWITFPKILPVLRTSALLSFLYCWMSFVVVLTLGGGIGFSTVEVLIYQAIKVDFNLSLALKLTVFQVCISLLLFSLLRNSSSFGAESRKLSFSLPIYLLRSAPARWGFATLGTLVVALLIVGPLITLAISGGRALLQTEIAPLLFSLGNSLMIASAVATASIAVSTLGVWVAYRQLSKDWSNRLMLLFRLPMALSAVVVSFVLLQSYGGFRGSVIGPIVAQSLLAVPIASALLYTAFQRIPSSFLFSGQSLGATAWKCFTLIELPLLIPSLKNAWLMVFAFSLGEVGSFLVFNISGQGTLPLSIYRLMGKYDFQSADAAAFLLMVAFCILFWRMEKQVRNG